MEAAIRPPVKLNLGAGSIRWPGFLAVDQADNWSGIPPDIAADLRSLPFDSGSVDEAHAIHVIEHFSRGETEKLLLEWKRVLKPGGLLVIECPCLDKIAVNLTDCEGDDSMWARLTLLGLYGEYWHGSAMQHLWCFSLREITTILDRLGFTDIKTMEPKFHLKERDMRVEARK